MRQTRNGIDGFSLLEMIAVMAIASVLAGSLIPSLIRSIQQSHSNAEAQSLTSLADSMRGYTLANKRIPSRAVNDWSVALAEIMSLPPSQIAKNQRGFDRALFFDPTFLRSTSSTFNGFSQNLGLTTAPYSPRAMFISDLNNNVATRRLSSAQFEALWQQSASAIYTESKEVKIERINFSPFFHRILLTNQNTSAAGFMLENGAMGSVQGQSGGIDGTEERHVLADSQLKLFDTTLSSAPLKTTVLVSGSISFRYVFSGTEWNWISP